jgi:antitoxin VapB
MPTAKLFSSGRSQAVRLPKAFRFQGTEVRIRRHGAAIILEPVETGWDWLDSVAAPLDNDFVQAATEQQPSQTRPALDHMQ